MSPPWGPADHLLQMIDDVLDCMYIVQSVLAWMIFHELLPESTLLLLTNVSLCLFVRMWRRRFGSYTSSQDSGSAWQTSRVECACSEASTLAASGTRYCLASFDLPWHSVAPPSAQMAQMQTRTARARAHIHTQIIRKSTTILLENCMNVWSTSASPAYNKLSQTTLEDFINRSWARDHQSWREKSRKFPLMRSEAQDCMHE